MANDIVVIQVSQVQAPIPSKLQQLGAVVSQGVTNLVGPFPETKLITQLADLTAIITPPQPITTLAWLSNTVTVTTTAPHHIPTGTAVGVTISGAAPTGYNGAVTATATGTNTFTYQRTTNPGVETVPGTWQLTDANRLLAAGTTFFAQGSVATFSVLELGIGTTAAGVATLTSYLTNNPNSFYVIKTPGSWAEEPTFEPLVAAYDAPTSMQYFLFNEFNASNIGTWLSHKSVIAFVPASTAGVKPSILPATEDDAAAFLYQILNTNPSPVSLVRPFAYREVFGVTAFPIPGNGAQLTSFKQANVNYIATGAEGGITNNIIKMGTTADGRDFSYWYSVDWCQINMKTDLANEVINGNNNPINPLSYDQHGINRLQTRAQNTMNSGVALNMVLSPVSVTAVPFRDYVLANPDDYPAGVYKGLACTFSPQRGFTQLVFQFVVTDFPLVA